MGSKQHLYSAACIGMPLISFWISASKPTSAAGIVPKSNDMITYWSMPLSLAGCGTPGGPLYQISVRYLKYHSTERANKIKDRVKHLVALFRRKRAVYSVSVSIL